MCINYDTLRSVLPPPCHPTAGWRHVNPGATTSRWSSAVIACDRCGAEWSARLDLEPVGASTAKTNADPKRSVDEIDVGYRQALELVLGGCKIKDACEQVGIATAQYYRRRNGTVQGRSA